MSLIKAIIFAILILSFISVQTYACKPLMHGRYDNMDDLVHRTEIIVLAKVKSFKANKLHGFEKPNKFDYTFSISKLLKGKRKSKQFIISEMDGPDSVETISFGLDCSNHGGFKKEKTYLIFLNSVNEKGYKELNGDNDPWLLDVKQKIKEQDEEHKNLLNKK